MRTFFVIMFLSTLLVGCEKPPSEALGTLEWDRVNGRAVQSEVIVELYVQQGDLVVNGAPILLLDNRKQLAVVKQLEAELQQSIWQEKELIAGPRQEDIAEAKARLNAAEADLITTSLTYERYKTLRKKDFASQELLDNSKNNYLNAKAQKKERTETLNKLLAGTRLEQLQQARAKVTSLEARLDNAKLLLEEYQVKAARNGRLDSLPYKLGDRPPMGAVVSTILSGDSPWVRVYIPEPWRSKMTIGNVYSVKVDGQESSFSAKLRSLEAKSSFTPYFALTEKDRSYLAYVAELDLTESSAKKLSAGTPVQLILEEK